MRNPFARKRTLALAVIAVLAGSAMALAYWTTTGSGAGSAGTATTQAVTVNQTNAAITNLYPGGPAKALSGDFDNPNDGAAYVASVTAAVSSVDMVSPDAAKPDCTPADFTISGTSNVPGNVAAGDNVGSWSGLSIAMTDATTNQDNCKGATVHVTYTANAA
jgi:hypothetical protein